MGKQLYGPASFIEKNSSDMKCAIGRFALPKSFLFHYDYGADFSFVITITEDDYPDEILAADGIQELKAVGNF
ncbi:hypothetical protein [Succinimonas amylolytica]|uniref:hypothetical protein n=1 Tax=Succinimonas amylolytica TaxID=83769 RepID=UPI0023A8CC2A